MSKGREINLRAPRLSDLHAHLHRAAASNHTLTRIVDAAFSEKPRDALDAEVRAIAAETMSSEPATTRKTVGSKRLRMPRFGSGAFCPDNIDLRVSFTAKHRPRHRRCSHSCTRVQLLENGEVVYEKPRPRVARLSLPSNGPTSRNFRNDMVQRGWEAHLILYRALAEVPQRFGSRHDLHQNAWSVEAALCRHESNLAPFVSCAPLRHYLSIGDYETASAQAHFRLEQLLERGIEDRNQLLEAARAMRDNKAAQVFQGRISSPEQSDFAASLHRLLSPVAPSDVVFRGMFIALATADTCAQGFAEAARPDAHTPPMTLPLVAAASAPQTAPETSAVAPAAGTTASTAAPTARGKARRPILGRGLPRLLGADAQPEPADPRRWVLCNLAKLQQSLLHDWETTLHRVRNLLVVLDIGNAQKLGALLSGPHESNWCVIKAAALKVQRIIDEAQPDLEAMNSAVIECTRSIENRTESISHAIAVLNARDAFAKSTQRVRAAFEASAKELDEHLQVLERAQAQHTSREMDALIQFLEGSVQVERALEMRRLLSDLHRMRKVADAGMRDFLKKPVRRTYR